MQAIITKPNYFDRFALEHCGRKNRSVYLTRVPVLTGTGLFTPKATDIFLTYVGCERQVNQA